MSTPPAITQRLTTGVQHWSGTSDCISAMPCMKLEQRERLMQIDQRALFHVGILNTCTLFENTEVAGKGKDKSHCEFVLVRFCIVWHIAWLIFEHHSYNILWCGQFFSLDNLKEVITQYTVFIGHLTTKIVTLNSHTVSEHQTLSLCGSAYLKVCMSEKISSFYNTEFGCSRFSACSFSLTKH